MDWEEPFDEVLTDYSLDNMMCDMARPKSAGKRNAILAATARVIVAHGLGASTARIAQEAGVSNGSLFTYFETKAELFNALYLKLKGDAAAAALDGLPAGAQLRDQVFHVWANWMRWAAANPDERRALAQLVVSEDVSPATRSAAHKTMAPVVELLERCRAGGHMRTVPMGFVSAILNALAEATMGYMAQDPAHADEHCRIGFEAFWRALS
jgi:AcrR family transcriptional regulator